MYLKVCKLILFFFFSAEIIFASTTQCRDFFNSIKSKPGLFNTNEIFQELKELGYSQNVAKKVMDFYPTLVRQIVENNEKPLLLYRGYRLKNPNHLVTSIRKNPSFYPLIFFSIDLHTAVKFSKTEIPGVSRGSGHFAVILELQIPKHLISIDPVNRYPTINPESIDKSIHDLEPFINRRAIMDTSKGTQQFPYFK